MGTDCNRSSQMQERTYPGLDFKFSLHDLPTEYLDRLGQCVNDCSRIISLINRYNIRATQPIHLTMWNDPISISGQDPQTSASVSEEYRAIKARNIANIYNDISARADAGEIIPVTVDEMFKYHEHLLQDIPQHPSMPAGRYRKGAMKVKKNEQEIVVGTCCRELPAYMEKLFWWLDSPAFESEQGSTLGNAFIKAIVAHMYFISIHPFYDGNGSLSRFLQYSILRNAGAPAQIAHLLANHYNETKEEYCDRLNAARASGDVTIFLDYALDGLSKKFSAYLNELLKDFPEIIRNEAREDKFILTKGFTILEILVVLAVLAILIGMAVPRIKGMQDQANITKTQTALKTIQAALEANRVNYGDYTSICVLPLDNPQLVAKKDLKDAWGEKFHAFFPGGDRRYYVIYSRGANHKDLSGGTWCSLFLDTPTGTPHEPAGCSCLFVTNAPVASMTPTYD